nr:hypothetical protein [Micromonospora provocatoris]
MTRSPFQRAGISTMYPAFACTPCRTVVAAPPTTSGGTGGLTMV